VALLHSRRFFKEEANMAKTPTDYKSAATKATGKPAAQSGSPTGGNKGIYESRATRPAEGPRFPSRWTADQILAH
jgi:hypothetical protein